MNNITKFFNTWGMTIIVPLTVIMFFQGCPTNSKIDGNSKEVEKLTLKLDSIPRMSQDEVIKIYDSKMWEYLEMEELADKKGISVTQLKHNKENTKTE